MNAAAAALLEARRERRILTALPAVIAPRDIAEGSAAQLALARLVNADPPGGFKIGAIARRMQEYLGLDSPIVGFMQARDIHEGDTALPFADLQNVGVECELAVRLAHDIPPGPCGIPTATGAVASLHAAIEIVENRYADLKLLGVPTLIADQCFHAACVLGPAVPDWGSINLAAMPGALDRDGVEIDHGVGADLMGHPMASLACVAASAEVAAFGGLRAGQVIMLGSVTPPIWLDRPGRIEVRFSRLPSAHLTFF